MKKETKFWKAMVFGLGILALMPAAFAESRFVPEGIKDILSNIFDDIYYFVN